MTVWDVYLGDREWERVHGASRVGTVEGDTEADARANMRAGLWSSVAHDATPGYWLVARKNPARVPPGGPRVATLSEARP